MINIEDYIQNFKATFSQVSENWPWEIIENLEIIIKEQIKKLNTDYNINNNVAIHKSAIVEPGVILKGTIIISENCYIGAHSYLRGPIFFKQKCENWPGLRDQAIHII